MTKLHLRGIDKKWDGFHAVKNLDLHIDDREFLVLLGPSGCGKATTMRMIAGLEEPTSGDLYFDAQRVNGVAPRLRDVSMVFQNYGLYPHMSVRQNIAYPLRLRRQGAAEIEAAVQRANATLPDYARIGRWCRATAAFSAETGLATANGRPQRAAIEQRHRQALGLAEPALENP